jgi:hypothetical protein
MNKASDFYAAVSVLTQFIEKADSSNRAKHEPAAQQTPIENKEENNHGN